MANVETAYRCESCDAVNVETAGEPLYECNECSLRFSKAQGLGRGHICPDCTNKMGSRVADDCCVDCQEGEVEEVEWCFDCEKEVADDHECGEEEAEETVEPRDEAADTVVPHDVRMEIDGNDEHRAVCGPHGWYGKWREDPFDARADARAHVIGPALTGPTEL